jgi:hypothetical protein
MLPVLVDEGAPTAASTLTGSPTAQPRDAATDRRRP